MDLIKNRKLALYFLGGLAAASKIPGVVPWALRRNKSFATIVLSLVGRALARTPLPRRDGRLVCGDVVLERITGTPPVRPLTRAAIVVLEYAGEFAISLRCDPQFFAPQDTRALLDLLIDQMRETIRAAK